MEVRGTVYATTAIKLDNTSTVYFLYLKAAVEICRARQLGRSPPRPNLKEIMRRPYYLILLLRP